MPRLIQLWRLAPDSLRNQVTARSAKSSKSNKIETTSGYSVVFTNIRSLVQKMDVLSAYCEDSDSDIVVLTETWLSPDVRDDELFPRHLDFSVFRCDRTQQRGGGVLIAIKKHISYFVVIVCHDLKLVCVCICSAYSKLVLIACYRPPNSDGNFTTKLQFSLLEIINRFPHANFLMFGDFNFPDICWSSLSSKGPSESRKFLELCLTFNLTQMVDSPTRLNNILDLVLSSSPDLVCSIDYSNGFSDHKLLQVTLTQPKTVKTQVSKMIHDFNRADYAEINRELIAYYVQFLAEHSTRTVECNWLLFRNK